MRAYVVGTGGYAKCVCDALLSNGLQDIAFLHPGEPDKREMYGFPILKEDSIYKEGRLIDVFVAIGDEWNREQYVTYVQNKWPNVCFPTITHSSAIIASSAVVEQGATVLAGAIVGSAVVVRRFATICTGAELYAQARVEQYATVGPKATVGQFAVIGRRSFIGLKAEVTNSVSIGTDSVIGAKSVVVSDIPPGTVAVGCPASIRRDRQPGPRDF